MIIDHRTVGAFQENTYLVMDPTSGDAVLIDPGDEPETLVAMVRAHGAMLRAIWLTHAHLDHIGGIAGVKRVYDVPVFMHPLDQPVFDRGEASAAGYGVPFEQPAPPDDPLAEGDRLRIGALLFDVWHLPGHAPGHVAFIGHGVTLSGDLLFAGSIGRTDFPGCDADAMEASLARLATLPGETVVYPGHGEPTTIGEERLSNPFLTGVVRIPRR